jgi:hypothetical protein
MRRIFCLIALTAGLAVGWTAAGPARVAGAEPEKGQVKAGAAERQRRAEAWYERNVIQAYQEHGRRDAAAGDALRAAARLWARSPSRAGDEFRQVVYGAHASFQSGAADPLVMYAYNRQLYAAYPETAWGTRCLLADQGAEQMANSKYPAVWKCGAAVWAGVLKANQSEKASPPVRAEATRLLDAALAWLREAAADRDLPPQLLHELARDLVEGYRRLSEATNPGLEVRKAGMDKVVAALGRALGAGHPTVLAIQGDLLVDFAWDARSNRFSDKVSKLRMDMFQQRLADAEKVLERAWELDPANVLAARRMITVEMGQGRGRDRMEQWFRRATEADPDCYAAYSAKALYLEPKWYGSEKDLLAFGRECLATQNWEGRVPFVLVDIHLALSRYPRGERKTWLSEPDPAYMAAPEVWEDLRSVYATYLARYPKAVYDRSMFAKTACWSGQWEEARRQFQELGEYPALTAFSNRDHFLRLRREATEKAANPLKPAARPDPREAIGPS